MITWELKKLIKKINKLEKKCTILENSFDDNMRKAEENFEYEKDELERNFNKKYKKLEKQNKFLQKIIEKFEENIKIFVKWICRTFKISENVVQNFQNETGIKIYSKQQYIKEQEKELEM